MPGMDTLQNMVERVFQAGNFEVVDNITVHPHIEATPSEPDSLHGCSVVPISTEKEVLGVFAVATAARRWFPNDEIDLLMDIGKSIGVEIEKASSDTFLGASATGWRLAGHTAHHREYHINQRDVDSSACVQTLNHFEST